MQSHSDFGVIAVLAGDLRGEGRISGAGVVVDLNN